MLVKVQSILARYGTPVKPSIKIYGMFLDYIEKSRSFVRGKTYNKFG
jgi:hypothetical protein